MVAKGVYGVVVITVIKYGAVITAENYNGVFSQTPVFHDQNDMRKALRLIKQIHVEFPSKRFVVYFVPLYEELAEPEIFARNVGMFKEVCEELDMKCYEPEGQSDQLN